MAAAVKELANQMPSSLGQDAQLPVAGQVYQQPWQQQPTVLALHEDVR